MLLSCVVGALVGTVGPASTGGGKSVGADLGLTAMAGRKLCWYTGSFKLSG